MTFPPCWCGRAFPPYACIRIWTRRRAVLAQALGLRDTEPFAGGIGRVGALPETMEAAAFAQFVGKALAAPVKWADAHGPVRRVAVVSGSGGDFSAEAAAAGADCLVTGEAGHHDALDALAAGVTLIAATHFATETAIAGVLAHRIAEAFPGLRVQRSVADADPFLYF